MSTKLQAALDWLKQPTTQVGLCLEVLAAGVEYTGILKGAASQLMPFVNFGVAFLLFPDNSTDRLKVADLSNQLMKAAATRDPAAVKAVIETAIKELVPAAPVPPAVGPDSTIPVKPTPAPNAQ